jgi:hypothetical protein
MSTTVLNQNLNRALVLIALMPANEINHLDPYESTLGKCCIDPLRPPDLPGLGSIAAVEALIQRELAIQGQQLSIGGR